MERIREQKTRGTRNSDIADRNGRNSQELDSRDNVVSFSRTLDDLKRQVDPFLVKQGQGWPLDQTGSVQMLDYVDWHTVADILDETAPNWSHCVKDIRPIGDFITVTVAITIDGVTREGIGTGPAQIETGIEKAEHDALKRAAVKFGIARELYRRESESTVAKDQVDPGDSDSPFPIDPIAQTLRDLVTAKQLGMIRALARDLRVDQDDECRAVMNCSTDQLTRRAASSLIQHLQDMHRQRKSSRSLLVRRAG